MLLSVHHNVDVHCTNKSWALNTSPALNTRHGSDTVVLKEASDFYSRTYSTPA